MTVYGQVKLGLKLRCGICFGLFILKRTANSYPIIKYKCIFVFTFNLFAHIKSDCDLLQHALTCSFFFLYSLNRKNVIFYIKRIHLKLLLALSMLFFLQFQHVILRFNLKRCKLLIFIGISVVQLLRSFSMRIVKKLHNILLITQ